MIVTSFVEVGRRGVDGPCREEERREDADNYRERALPIEKRAGTKEKIGITGQQNMCE